MGQCCLWYGALRSRLWLSLAAAAATMIMMSAGGGHCTMLMLRHLFRPPRAAASCSDIASTYRKHDASAHNVKIHMS